MEKLLLRVSEAAELASVGRTTAYQLIASGEWPVVPVGTALRIPLAGLRAWVEARSTQGSSLCPNARLQATAVQERQ